MSAPVVRFVPFGEADFEAWLALAVPGYALEHVRDGQWTLAESIGKSREAHASLLPQGLATPGHSFVRLVVPGEAEDAGFLWWSEVEAAGRPGAYVHGVEVAGHARRRGVARAAFAELERVARLRGLPVREMALRNIVSLGPSNVESPRLRLATLDGRRIA